MTRARLLGVVAVTGCLATRSPVTGPGASHLAVQSASADGLRVIAFDANDAIGAMLGVERGMPTMALALPNGDWLVELDGHVAARVSPDGAVRWSRELALGQAIVAGDDLVVATSIAGDDLSIIGVRGDGTVAWRTDGGAVRTRLRLVRTHGATVVAHGSGELAIDDAGAARWRLDQHGSDPLAAAVDGAGVVIVRAAAAAPETAFLPRPRMPMVARLIDPRTGAERARAELAPDADAWALADVAVAGNRVVVRAADSGSSGFVYKLVVFAVGRDSIAVTDAFVPSAVAELERVPPIGRDEAVFLGARELGHPAPLEITLVDPRTRRVRRAPVIRVPAGSFVQLVRQHSGDAVTFIGDLQGTLVIGDRRLHADVRQEQDMSGRLVFSSLWLFGGYFLSR